MDKIELDERLSRIEKLLLSKKEVLTFDEACEYTGISRSYLYKLTSGGKVPFSKPNGKMIYFDIRKLKDWMLSNGRKSKEEIEIESLNYSFNNDVKF